MDINRELDSVIRRTSQQMNQPAPADIPEAYIRYAVVTLKSAGVSTIQFAGDDPIPNIKSLYDNFTVGDTVMVTQYGGDMVILGGLRNNFNGEPERNIANGIVNVNTGGACIGKWGNGAGSGVSNIPVTATDVDLYLGVAGVPVKPNRLIRVRFRIAGADKIGGAYLTTTMYVGWNGGGYGAYRRNLQYAAGAGVQENDPIFDEWVFATPSNASSFSCKFYGNTNTGTAYYYRYATYTGQDQSQITVDDIGTAEDFLGQGGVSG